MEHAGLKVGQRQHRSYWPARDSQCVLSAIGATRPAKLKKVWRDNLQHARLIEARLLTPKLLFELLECGTIMFAQFHARVMTANEEDDPMTRSASRATDWNSDEIALLVTGWIRWFGVQTST